MAKSYKHYVEQKKPKTKEYKLYDSIYMKFDRKKWPMLSGDRFTLGVERKIARKGQEHESVFQVQVIFYFLIKVLVLYRHYHFYVKLAEK